MTNRTLRALVAFIAAIALAAPASAGAFDNGRATAADVAPINVGFDCPALGGQLENRAAAGWNSLALREHKPIPTNGCDSAYRPIERQVYWRNFWCAQGACGNAAIPGTSNHGLGRAVDVPTWVRGLIDLRGRRFGFDKSCSDAAHEWWHVLFCAPYGRPNPGLRLNAPTLRKGSGGPGQAAWVRKVQRLLRRHGARSVTVDGTYGRRTRHYVWLFQKAEGLKPDGVVGPRTWRRLRQPVVNDEHSPQPPPTPAPPAQPPDPAPPTPPSAPREPLYGVDVSQHQGDIEWGDVRRDGYAFAIAKATEGQDFQDPGFSKGRLDAIEAAGLVPGVYHFLRPRADRPGSREATWFVQVIANAGFERGFLPPVVDIEQTSLSDAGTCRYLGSFVRRVRAALEVQAIVYTYPSFAREHLAGCKWLRRHRLWIAHYTSARRPEIPAPWDSYVIHQFRDNGDVDGIQGPVDVNRLPGGRRRLQRLRIGEEPKRNQQRLAIPPADPRREIPIARLIDEVPAAEETPLEEVPLPEGDRVSPTRPEEGND
jgi:GH25 family lysozyme M1 (1,4-beta-N-acetylmuramidase)